MSEHPISPNSRESIGAVDSISGDFFYVEGTESTGAINVNVAGGTGDISTIVGIGPVGQFQVPYDTIVYTNTSVTVDTYTYKEGGTSGTTTATVTITYVDSSKAQISTVVRT